MAIKKTSSPGSMVLEPRRTPFALDRTAIPMNKNAEEGMTRDTVQALSHREINRRIERVTNEVISAVGGGIARPTGEHSGNSPSWISPAELVDRMRPFLILN